MRTRPNLPQKGNPHRLVVNQHVYPKASIDRFVDGGGVDLLDLKRGIRRRARSRDPVFCAVRAWDNMAETGFMKRTEDVFQTVARRVLVSPFDSLSADDFAAIRTFYAMWHARAERRHLTHQSISLKGILPGEVLTAAEVEQLEANGCMTLDGDGTIPFRHINAHAIRFRAGRLAKQLEGMTWGVISPISGEFFVPNTPVHGIIPISPSLALVQNSPSGRITEYNLRELNRAILAHAGDYIFARSLDACPGALAC